MVTPEEQFLSDVQSAYERYAAVFPDQGERPPRRMRELQYSVGKLVGQVSEINWCVRNEREW